LLKYFMRNSSIYIHVPWCRRRCPYCNFYLVVGRPDDNFRSALIQEWEHRGACYQNRPATSLYFGGGTPSLLAPFTIGQLIEYFLTKQALSSDAEITLEVNPEDITEDYVRALINTGVNRVSMGVQSFDNAILKYLGRKHTASIAQMAISRLQSCGFTNISVDLIVGMEGERLSALGDSIRYLNDRGIEHVSAYLLTIEDGTAFHRRIRQKKMLDPNEDAQVTAFRYVQDTLQTLGFVQYDISSYAKNDRFSRHNQLYWSAENYIGLGPGAHSMRMLPDGSVNRSLNYANLNAWLINPRDQNKEVELLTPKDALRESLAFGLRNMVAGINPNALAARHQVSLPKDFLRIVEKFNNCGWLEESQGALRITKEGALFADAVMRDVLCC
jgi:oxygen-independent coproporphyrinogen-3 oxidase